MRFARFTLFLSILIGFAAMHPGGFVLRANAFESEQKRTYTTPNAQVVLRIISTADIDVFEPIIYAFQQKNPLVNIEYVVASSTELMKAIYQENLPFDLAISSAMDLQTKLANDGFARTYSSVTTDAMPGWAKWRNQLFGFTQEPAVLVISEADFLQTPIPSTRDELIELLRDNSAKFDRRVGTYDVRTSGLGYLFATQDSRNTEAFWRLTEVMGRLNTRLYCCSGDMITDVASGKIALAYNVLGSYAESRLQNTDGIRIVPLDDFLSVMLRTALIPAKAENPLTAGLMIDFLVELKDNSELGARTGLPPIDPDALQAESAMRPIQFGPGLLVFLDKMRRETFLRSWINSITQN